jgi:hypothetical protein
LLGRCFAFGCRVKASLRSGEGDMLRAGICAKTTVIMVLILALIAAGCGGAPEGPGGDSRPAEPITNGGAGGEAPRPATKVLVTSEDPSLPDGCRPREIAELVLDFFDAFNRGDQERLSRLFFISEGPSPPDFSEEGYYPWSWYSVSEVGPGGRIEDGFVTYNQGELLRYFAERYGQREHLGLIKVSATQAGLLGEEGNVGIVFVLTRDARDLEPGLGGPARIAIGKGAINCASRKIFVWSMEMRAREDRSARQAAGWLCTDPPGWKPGSAVVACA